MSSVDTLLIRQWCIEVTKSLIINNAMFQIRVRVSVRVTLKVRVSVRVRVCALVVVVVMVAVVVDLWWYHLSSGATRNLSWGVLNLLGQGPPLPSFPLPSILLPPPALDALRPR